MNSRHVVRSTLHQWKEALVEICPLSSREADNKVFLRDIVFYSIYVLALNRTIPRQHRHEIQSAHNQRLFPNRRISSGFICMFTASMSSIPLGTVNKQQLSRPQDTSAPAMHCHSLIFNLPLLAFCSCRRTCLPRVLPADHDARGVNLSVRFFHVLLSLV